MTHRSYGATSGAWRRPGPPDGTPSRAWKRGRRPDSSPSGPPGDPGTRHARCARVRGPRRGGQMVPPRARIGDTYTCWGGATRRTGPRAAGGAVVTPEARGMRPGPRERTTACTRSTSDRGHRPAGTPLGTRCPFRRARAPSKLTFRPAVFWRDVPQRGTKFTEDRDIRVASSHGADSVKGACWSTPSATSTRRGSPHGMHQ
jgi:hypothetical protein